METIKRDLAQAQRPALQFGDASWKGLIQAALFFGFIALITGFSGGNPVENKMPILPAVTALIFLALGVRRGYFSGKPSWFVLKNKEGLYINLGFSGGHPVSGASDEALFMTDNEIDSICITREVQRLPHRFGATRHHFASLDIHLAIPLPDSIRCKIEEQQQLFRKSGKAGPFPIRPLSPTLLRLNWGWVHPVESRAAVLLGEHYPTLPPRKILFPDWSALDTPQQRLYLAELWRMGMTSEAVFLARGQFNLSKTEAACQIAASAEVEPKY